MADLENFGGEGGDVDGPVTAIIDNGSGYIKAGTSIDDQPSVVYPTLVGRPRRRFIDLYTKETPEGIPEEGVVFVGEEAIANRHHLSFTYPIDHGHIDNWVDMEEVWNKTYSLLGLESSEHAVLITEPPLCSLRHREKMAEMFFEIYNVPELNISVTGLMAIYGTGRTTGFVLDIGEGITQCVPVFDGYLEKASVKRSDFGGQELQMYLQKILCDMGYPMTTRDDYEHVRVIKETLCFCSLNPAEDQQRDDLEKTYHLPDGLTLRDGSTTEITLGPERFYPPEALFNPQLCGRDNPSLIDLVWSSIMACPIESRKSLIASVVLSGSSTMFPGFPERLEQELKNTAPPQARPHVHVLSHPSRGTLVWQGARLYCQPAIRPMQDHLWVSRQEWDEVGAKIVARKEKKYFIACIYNKQGDSYRSPWTNHYVSPPPPLLLSPQAEAAAEAGAGAAGAAEAAAGGAAAAGGTAAGAGAGAGAPTTTTTASTPTAATATAEKKPRPFKPSEHLRQLEVAYNELFDAYRRAYYDGGVSSVYLWSLQSEDGFAGAFLIHHSIDGQDCACRAPGSSLQKGRGMWDSVHVVEVTQTSSNVYYRLTSTVIVDIQQQQQQLLLQEDEEEEDEEKKKKKKSNSSSNSNSSNNGGRAAFYAGVVITRLAEQSHKIHQKAESRMTGGGGPEAYPHIGVIGRMIENMELNLRTTIEHICFATAYSVIDCAFGPEIHCPFSFSAASTRGVVHRREGRGRGRISSSSSAAHAAAAEKEGEEETREKTVSLLPLPSLPSSALWSWGGDRLSAATISDHRVAVAACAAGAAAAAQKKNSNRHNNNFAAEGMTHEAKEEPVKQTV